MFLSYAKFFIFNEILLLWEMKLILHMLKTKFFQKTLIWLLIKRLIKNSKCKELSLYEVSCNEQKFFYMYYNNNENTFFILVGINKSLPFNSIIKYLNKTIFLIFIYFLFFVIYFFLYYSIFIFLFISFIFFLLYYSIFVFFSLFIFFYSH